MIERAPGPEPAGPPFEGQGDPRHGQDRAQIRGSTLLLVGRMLAAGLNLVAQVLIVRTLSQEGFGVFAYALAVAGVGEVLAMAGLRHGVSRFVPIYEQRGEHAKVVGTLLLTAATVLVLGLAFVLVVVTARGMVAGNVADDSTGRTVLVILALLAPLMSVENLLDALFAVVSRPSAIFLRQYVLVPMLRLGAVLVIMLGTRSVVVLAVGYLVAGLLGVVVGLAVLARLLRERGSLARWRNTRPRVPFGEVLPFSLPLFADDVTALLISAADALLLGQLATAAEVATLRAVLPVAGATQYVEFTFGLLFLPLAARRFAAADVAAVSRLYWRTTIWSVVLAFPLLAVSIVLAEPVTTLLFGSRYADAAPVLAVLAGGYYLSAAAGPNRTLLVIYGRVREVVTVNLVAITTNVGLNVLLIPRHGAMGAAIATFATFATRNLLLQVVLHRRTGVRGIEPTLVMPYATVLAAASIVVGAATIGVGPLVGTLLVASTGLAVLAAARRHLRLVDTFPELVRIPMLGRVLTTPHGRAGPGGRR